MEDSGFARDFKKLIHKRVKELINEAESIAMSRNSANYKRREIDKRIEMVDHNFTIFWSAFGMPHGQQESILQNLKLLYKIQ